MFDARGDQGEIKKAPPRAKTPKPKIDLDALRERDEAIEKAAREASGQIDQK